MLIIENCNSLSDLRQKLIDGEEVRTARQEPCENLIIEWKKDFKEYVNSLSILRDDYKGIMEYIDELPVTPQPKVGCEGCIYEKTGNNSTYPCSHCGRCYTDKYKTEGAIRDD